MKKFIVLILASAMMTGIAQTSSGQAEASVIAQQEMTEEQLIALGQEFAQSFKKLSIDQQNLVMREFEEALKNKALTDATEASVDKKRVLIYALGTAVTLTLAALLAKNLYNKYMKEENKEEKKKEKEEDKDKEEDKEDKDKEEESEDEEELIIKAKNNDEKKNAEDVTNTLKLPENTKVMNSGNNDTVKNNNDENGVSLRSGHNEKQNDEDVTNIKLTDIVKVTTLENNGGTGENNNGSSNVSKGVPGSNEVSVVQVSVIGNTRSLRNRGKIKQPSKFQGTSAWKKTNKN